jgi:PAS domain S-box-containing protein
MTPTLANSEARFRTSFHHAPLPILLYDDHEQVLAISDRRRRESGYLNESINRLEDWTALAHGERSGEVLEHIRQIVSGEPVSVPGEFVIRTKEGRVRRRNFFISALRTIPGKRRLIITVAQDVTESKEQEENLRLVMREVNHRDKNLLAIVQTIARLTSATTAPRDFVANFTDCIQALAVNQDLLVRNEWSGVDIEDLVRSHTGSVAD